MEIESQVGLERILNLAKNNPMNTNKLLIFIVDDSRSVRTFFSAALKNFGFEVEGFENPLPCLEALKLKNPDCILTDYEMPEMNGLDFCKEIKSNKATQGIPVILLSNHDDDNKIINALNAGADDYLPKTTNPEITLGKVRLMAELKKHRESTLIEERSRTYRATAALLAHELNNIMAIVLPLLQSNEEQIMNRGPLIKEQYKLLHRNLDRLAGTIKSITKQVEEQIEFEYYSGEAEIIRLKKS